MERNRCVLVVIHGFDSFFLISKNFKMQLSQRRFQEKQNLLASLGYWEQNIENCYEDMVALIPVIQYSERRWQEVCQ